MLEGKTNIHIVVVTIAALIIGGSIIVLSQGKQKKIEISSPSGLKRKPVNLVAPRKKESKKGSDQPTGIPVDVSYRQIFKHIAELNRKADTNRQKGRDTKKVRNLYKKMARLSERDARTLDRIAEKTNRELKKLDDRAKRIIGRVRSQTPGRRIEQGQKVPLPPQELFDLAKQRRDITAKAIKDLRKSMGVASFVGFTKFVNEKVKPGIRKHGNGVAIQQGGKKK